MKFGFAKCKVLPPEGEAPLSVLARSGIHNTNTADPERKSGQAGAPLLAAARNESVVAAARNGVLPKRYAQAKIHLIERFAAHITTPDSGFLWES